MVEVAPYWNVNNTQDWDFRTFGTVEVAPYWNVNEFAREYVLESTYSRSSTILECK